MPAADGCERAGGAESPTLNALATLRPLGQLRDSFILAANQEGLWIIDQHVAHERVLFEKILRERQVETGAAPAAADAGAGRSAAGADGHLCGDCARNWSATVLKRSPSVRARSR